MVSCLLVLRSVRLYGNISKRTIRALMQNTGVATGACCRREVQTWMSSESLLNNTLYEAVLHAPWSVLGHVY